MQIDRGKTEKAFGPLRPSNSFSDMNTRGTGLGGDPIFADLFAQKPKGYIVVVVLIGIVEN